MKLSYRKLFAKLFTVIIALTFIFSAYSKLVNTSEFAEIIYNYGFGRLNFLAPVIVIFELLLGLNLLFFIRVKQTLLITLITLILFTLIFSYGLFFKNIESCGCFGSFFSKLLDNPLALYIKNTILIALSFIAYKLSKNEKIKELNLKLIVISIITSFGIFFSGYTFKPSQEVNSVSIDRFLNKTTAKVGLENFYKFSEDSTYIAVIFSYTCPHCLNTMANVNLFKESGYVDNIVYLPVGGGQAKIDFDKNYKIIGPRIDGASAGISRISGNYPTILFIKNNSVIFVNEGFIQAPLVFFRFNNLELNKN